MFREFAVTITVAILVSGFVSLTLTPMLCARILSAPKHGEEAGWFARVSDLFVDGCRASIASRWTSCCACGSSRCS